jgi:PAS domain S-box-containing protein
MTRSAATARWILALVAVYAAGVIGFTLPKWGAHFPLPTISGGIAAAVTYRWGRRMWSAAFIASVVMELSVIHRPVFGALTVAAGLAGGAVLVAWLLERLAFEPSFGRPRDVWVFVFAVVVGAIPAPAVGMAGLLLTGYHFDSLVFSWFRWWTNTMLGFFLIGPALIAMNRQSFARLGEHWLEGAVWILSVAACCGAIVWMPGPMGRSLIVTLAILITVVGAIRFGLVVSALGTVAISIMTALSFVFSIGLFGNSGEVYGRLTLFVFSATLVATDLIVTALLAERDAAARETLRAEHRYAQIFNGSTQAIWVHDPVEENFLLVNDAAQRQYGWTGAEFLARKVSALAPPNEPRVLPTRREGDIEEKGYTTPFETRHVTKDGRILDVEVWMHPIDLGGRPAELVFAIDVSDYRTLGKALIDVLAREQRRIAGEIHDGLGQELTGLALSLRALATRAERREQVSATDLDDLAKLAARCIEGSKRIVQGLSPLSDAGGSLSGALEALARRASLSGTPVRFRKNNGAQPRFRNNVLDHFYRIAQEAVQNALKHAAGSAIDIDLWTDSSSVRLSVSDDGRGFSADAPIRQGLGMRTMHFRAGAIGGRLVIEAGRRGGTVVRCEVRQ